jgi:CheY-like chemotaxis protein
MTYNWNDKKILIVDDEQLIHFFYKEIFKNSGANLIHATDGRTSVNICKENSDVDIVLMDIHLPNLNGYEALNEIRKINADIPVIAQTAFALSEDRDTAIKAGFDEYVSKPINKKEVTQLIEYFFFKKKILQ